MWPLPKGRLSAGGLLHVRPRWPLGEGAWPRRALVFPKRRDDCDAWPDEKRAQTMPSKKELHYRKISGDLRRAIIENEWDEERALPTDQELALQYGVGRQTVRHAYQELVREGLVVRAPGRGSFVARRDGRYGRSFASVDDLVSLSSDTVLMVRNPLRADYDAGAAEQLELSIRALYSIQFYRLHRDVPFSVTTVYLPLHLGVLLEDVSELAEKGGRTSQTIVGMLQARGVDIDHAEQAITAVAATEEVCGALDVPLGLPLLWVSRRYLTVEGQPVEFAVSHYLPSMYTHRLRLGRVGPYSSASL